jgi:hypothetical protein
MDHSFRAVQDKAYAGTVMEDTRINRAGSRRVGELPEKQIIAVDETAMHPELLPG